MLLSLYPKFCTGSEATHFKKALPSEDQTEETLKPGFGKLLLRPSSAKNIFYIFKGLQKKGEKKGGKKKRKIMQQRL